MNKKRIAAALAAAIVSLAAGGVWWGLSRPAAGAAEVATDGQKPAAPLDFVATEVVRPARMRIPERITFSGPLVAPVSAVVRAKAAGRLLMLSVAEGDRVQAGQVLGRVDQSDVQSRVAEREAMVASARAGLSQAERVLAQNRSLATQKFISDAALDGSQAAVETARAQLQAAVASLHATQVVLRDGSLLAPVTGIVAKRHALPGESLSHEQPVVSLVNLARLELAGSVATHEVSRLVPGMAVQVRVEGHDQPVQAQIARIAPAAEPGTRAIGVTVALLNPQERYRAGQFGMVEVALPDTTERWVLPLTAVGNSGGQSHVWTIAQDKLQRRSVTLGRRDEAGGRVEVLAGLPADSQVLAARFEDLREGAPARVLAARAESIQAASAAASAPSVR
jgi:RND family efflux transporter MFP subunit